MQAAYLPGRYPRYTEVQVTRLLGSMAHPDKGVGDAPPPQVAIRSAEPQLKEDGVALKGEESGERAVIAI